jgi:hypothetical protein
MAWAAAVAPSGRGSSAEPCSSGARSRRTLRTAGGACLRPTGVNPYGEEMALE